MLVLGKRYLPCILLSLERVYWLLIFLFDWGAKMKHKIPQKRNTIGWFACPVGSI
jgi:hypothetical protein